MLSPGIITRYTMVYHSPHGAIGRVTASLFVLLFPSFHLMGDHPEEVRYLIIQEMRYRALVAHCLPLTAQSSNAPPAGRHEMDATAELSMVPSSVEYPVICSNT